jgi:aspartyl-tRNA synthetase
MTEQQQQELTEKTEKLALNKEQQQTSTGSLEEDVVLGEDGKPLSKNALKKLQKDKEKAAKKAEQERQRLQQQQAEDNAPDYSVDRYGKLPLNQSQQK